MTGRLAPFNDLPKMRYPVPGPSRKLAAVFLTIAKAEAVEGSALTALTLVFKIVHKPNNSKKKMGIAATNVLRLIDKIGVRDLLAIVRSHNKDYSFWKTQ